MLPFVEKLMSAEKTKIKMADLKQLFHDYGFREVKTYIQSGNVLFDSDKDQHLLSDIIFMFSLVD
jgi:uncharacterized protein (DUF1697 family)